MSEVTSETWQVETIFGNPGGYRCRITDGKDEVLGVGDTAKRAEDEAKFKWSRLKAGRSTWTW